MKQDKYPLHTALVQLSFNFERYIIISIQRGSIQVHRGSFLPSLEKLAKEKKVSISTVRRTLLLLGYIGATRSVNGVGTLVMSLDKSADNCDFTQPIVRKRLMDFAESLHFLALSCRAAFLGISHAEHAWGSEDDQRILSALL